VESIVGQQISNKAAATVCSKLSDLCGMDAHKLHTLPLAEIQLCGMSMRKAEYIKNVAEVTVNKTIDFDSFPNKSDEEIIQELSAIKGVGIWTAEMILIF
jgi:DNA-3-methyladenine glycosylase II